MNILALDCQVAITIKKIIMLLYYGKNIYNEKSIIEHSYFPKMIDHDRIISVYQTEFIAFFSVTL
jgi:hypothetical protein